MTFRMVQIGGDDVALLAHFGFNQEGEIRRAGADVECASVPYGGHVRRGEAFPMVMKAETQQGVVEIVDARDRGEHPLDGLLARLAGPGRDGLRLW